MLVRAAAAACQPYSSVKQLVSCAPAALTKLRVPPHMGGFSGLCVAGSGREAQPVPMECGSQRKRCNLQVYGGRYGPGGGNSSVSEKFVRFWTLFLILCHNAKTFYFFVTKGQAK